MAPKLIDEEKYPELFQPDANIDRRTCRRTIPMEVLSLGLSRTGTTCESITVRLGSFSN